MRSGRAQAEVWLRKEHRALSEAGSRRGEGSASGPASGLWLLCAQLHLLAPECGARLLLLLTDSTPPSTPKTTELAPERSFHFTGLVFMAKRMTNNKIT